MTTKENLKYQLLAAQCGFAFEILFTIFWAWFGHNLPPASPNLGAQELAVETPRQWKPGSASATA